MALKIKRDPARSEGWKSDKQLRRRLGGLGVAAVGRVLGVLAAGGAVLARGILGGVAAGGAVLAATVGGGGGGGSSRVGGSAALAAVGSQAEQLAAGDQGHNVDRDVGHRGDKEQEAKGSRLLGSVGKVRALAVVAVVTAAVVATGGSLIGGLVSVLVVVVAAAEVAERDRELAGVGAGVVDRSRRSVAGVGRLTVHAGHREEETTHNGGHRNEHQNHLDGDPNLEQLAVLALGGDEAKEEETGGEERRQGGLVLVLREPAAGARLALRRRRVGRVDHQDRRAVNCRLAGIPGGAHGTAVGGTVKVAEGNRGGVGNRLGGLGRVVRRGDHHAENEGGKEKPGVAPHQLVKLDPGGLGHRGAFGRSHAGATSHDLTRCRFVAH